MPKPKTKAKNVVMDPPIEVNPADVPNQGLDDMKIERAQDIGQVVAKLCSQAKRKDATAILQHVIDDLDQLFLIGQEIGRRLERDSTARKLPR